jgi:diguanylate cyclase (GGDEF)-like protein
VKIEEVRTSFTVYVIASQTPTVAGVSEALGQAGYMVANFNELTAAFSELYSNPPHIIIFDAQERQFDLGKAIKQVMSQLPESHVFLVTKVENRSKAAAWLDQGAYDLILTPFTSPLEPVRAVDRAAERDYFMYLNERLMENKDEPARSGPDPKESEPPTQITTVQPGLGEDFHLEYARKLFEQTTVDEAIQVFMSSASNALGSCPAVYFRFIPNRRVLLAGFGEKVEGVDLRDLGMNLNEAVEGFRATHLREPMKIAPFVQMVKEVFGAPAFFAVPVRALTEIQGLVCFLVPEPKGALIELTQEWLALLEKAVSLVEAEKRLHVVSIRDPVTDLLNRQAFLTRVTEEISRSRRTHFPTSLILIAVDQFGQLTSSYGQEEAQLVFRTVGKILQKHSRVNDILARTGVDEFGMLLPHTGREGGLIKAERLRLIVESADFSKVLSRFPKLTVSVGVSEYPGLVRDAEELVQSADEALYQVRGTGNKISVARVPANFQPDFQAMEKAP